LGSTLHHTKAIVLRAIPYGESSLIVTAYTELFGLQSYLVQGIRKAVKQKASVACFQPGALLEIVVYYNSFRQLHRIREFKWAQIYQTLFSDVTKNSILLYMVELLLKTVRQPESHPDLFHFIEDSFLELDHADEKNIANYPLFFSVHLSAFFGFQPNEKNPDTGNLLDLQEGIFTNTTPLHPHYAEGKVVVALKELLKVRLPHELNEVPLTNTLRREALQVLELFYALHIAEFGKMKSTAILQEVLS